MGLVDGTQGGSREVGLGSAEKGDSPVGVRSDLPDVLGPGEGGGDGEADHFDGGAFLQLGSFN